MKHIAWHTLTNAVGIAAVLDSLQKDPYRWGHAYNRATGDCGHKAIVDQSLAAKTVCYDRHFTSGMEEALNTAWNLARMVPSAYAAASAAIIALAAYDDAMFLLEDGNIDELKQQAAQHCQEAILLLPATYAMH